MSDQATILRQKMSSLNEKVSHVVAVVSGKGGVGKSVFCVNFMAALRENNKKTIVIDMDIGMGNVEFLLGAHARYSIMDMIVQELSIWDVIATAPNDLSYIAGGSGLSEFFSLNNEHLNYFFEEIDKLKTKFDYILLDFGAGITKESLDYILAAHQIILVTTPEPTSLTDAYSTIKYIHMKDPEHPIGCVINQIDDDKEGRTAWTKLSGVSERFLNKQLQLFEMLPREKIVVKSVKQQVPYLYLSPHAKISTTMKRFAGVFSSDGILTAKAQSMTFIARLKHFLEKRGKNG